MPPALHLLVELVAIVGDERHAADDDVVGLPAVGVLLHAVVDLHRRPARPDDLGAHGDVGRRPASARSGL